MYMAKCGLHVKFEETQLTHAVADWVLTAVLVTTSARSCDLENVKGKERDLSCTTMSMLRSLDDGRTVGAVAPIG